MKNNYSDIPYTDGGRDAAHGLDCWGLVRYVFHHEYSGPLLPEFSGVFNTDKPGMNTGYDQINSMFEECMPEPGAIAACFMVVNGRRVFHHVGICTGFDTVLNTTADRGVYCVPVRVFNRLSAVVKYYKLRDCYVG